MGKQHTEKDLEQIANQLGHPKGEQGIITAERMAHTNNNMIMRTIEGLNLKNGDVVLEIGPGNGAHLKHLIAIADVRYYGIDISDTMVTEANKINASLVNSGHASFELTPADQLNFSIDFFDKIFTVNTLYFWEDALAYAAEILRVLKPGGVFNIAIATKEFMEQLPFTKFNFKLYDLTAISKLLSDAGFLIENVAEQKDLTTSNTGDVVNRDIIIVTAKKAVA